MFIDNEKYTKIDVIPEQNNLHNEDIMEDNRAAVIFRKNKINNIQCQQQPTSLLEHI